MRRILNGMLVNKAERGENNGRIIIFSELSACYTWFGLEHDPHRMTVVNDFTVPANDIVGVKPHLQEPRVIAGLPRVKVYGGLVLSICLRKQKTPFNTWIHAQKTKTLIKSTLNGDNVLF